MQYLLGLTDGEIGTPKPKNPKLKAGRASQDESLIFSKYRADLQQKIGLEKDLVGAVVRPLRPQALSSSARKPLVTLNALFAVGT